MTEQQDPGKYEKQSRRATIECLVLAALIVAAWFGFGFFVAWHHVECNGMPCAVDEVAPAVKAFKFLDGTFGDTFGTLTALFTGLALAGLWYTLRLQRIELSATRDELGSQAASLRQQAAVLKKQEFEGTFFQLLHRFSETTDRVIIPGSAGLYAFKDLYHDFTGRYTQYRNTNPGQGSAIAAQQCYELFLKEHGHVLNHYFRNLYHVIKHVDESGLTLVEKYRYASIARAQLSTYELLHLLYNGMCGEGLGFQHWIEDYALLKHAQINMLAGINEAHEMFYSDRAFRNELVEA